MQAQLGFCGGSSGDPIFTETFGSGISNNALPSGTTTYNFINGFPDDGFYTVSNGTFGNFFDWHQIQDHTINDTNGKCLIVNAATAPGEFYKTTISGLCETTTYQFSAWLINLARLGGFCSSQPGGTIPINVRFEIWDSTDTNRLAFGDTGNIIDVSVPIWENYGLVFQTLAGQNTVILKMINNGAGGCGNDLAIDDIEFKSCGDMVTVTDNTNNSSVNLCSTQTPFLTTLMATPDFSVYNSHFYQWQQSVDSINWNDIIGENSQTLSVSISNSSYYRAKIAEVAVNLTNPLCVSFSDEYEININQLPARPSLTCWQMATINATNCSWDVTGVQPTQPIALNCWDNFLFDALSCTWVNNGDQDLQPLSLNCWDNYQFNTGSCSWDNMGSQPVKIIEKTVELCSNSKVTLQAQTNITNPSFTWSTNQISTSIMVNTSGLYSVEISGDNCTFETIIFNVIDIEDPVIESVISNGNNIVITTQNTGDFLYALDDNIFQLDNTFYNVEGGLYNIFVKQQNCSTAVSLEYLHFYIPKYFTPNNDGVNDGFDLSGIELYDSSQVSIFDRYGKLLKFSRNTSFSWDGTYNNKPMPTDDYWYVVIIDNQKFMGNFTLKR